MEKYSVKAAGWSQSLMGDSWLRSNICTVLVWKTDWRVYIRGFKSLTRNKLHLYSWWYVLQTSHDQCGKKKSPYRYKMVVYHSRCRHIGNTSWQSPRGCKERSRRRRRRRGRWIPCPLSSPGLECLDRHKKRLQRWRKEGKNEVTYLPFIHNLSGHSSMTQLTEALGFLSAPVAAALAR